jgi:hypothetical protein
MTKIMLRLFQRNIFFEKCFSYFLLFVETENKSQTKNIFSLTKKTSLASKNDLHF